MDKNPDEADKRFRAEAIKLRLREDLISLRVRFLRRGIPAEADYRALAQIHREVMQSLQSLRRRHSGRALPSQSAGPGLADSGVELAAYDPAWPTKFSEEAATIRRNLGELCAEVHHVGSTSVPGMPAKPIVDIAVSVRPAALLSSLPECIGAMTAAGYDYYGDWGHHGGHYFAKSSGSLRTSSAQLHAEGSEDLEDLLAFRDAARANPTVLTDYADLKKALASVLYRDRGLYVWCKGHWLTDRSLADWDDRAWGDRQLRAQHPTLVQLGFRGMMARLRPRFAGRGLHPMALRTRRKPGY